MNLGNNEQTWTIACGTAVVLLLAMAVGDILMPHPSQDAANRQAIEKQRMLLARNIVSQKLVEDAEVKRSGYTWKISPDRVGPEIMTDLTGIAAKNKVTVGNFRPAKVTAADSVNLMSFDTNITGSYRNTAQFLKVLEEPDNLLIVQSVQISNSNGATDDVSLNLSLTAVVDSAKNKFMGAKKA